MDTSIGGNRHDFPATSWSVIREASDRAAPAYVEAMNTLCALYWKPVYAYIRAARSYGNEEAKDLTQEFLFDLVQGDLLKRFVPDRGHFRSYLRGALHLFLLERHREAGAQKRGGDHKIVSLTAEETGPVDRLIAGSHEAADALFEKQWSRSVLDHAVNDLRAELFVAKREACFRIFERHQLNPPIGGAASYAELAAEFSVSEFDVNNCLAHCRKLLRDKVAARIREYVNDEAEVSEEISRLFSG